MEKDYFCINEKGQKVGTYRLAGFNVEISSAYKRIHAMCYDYRTDGEPEIRIETTADEIERERDSFVKEIGEDQPEAKNHYIETLLVYRKLSLCLLDHGILLMHGSCLAVDGEGVLFTALSGTGKSTHTRMWREMLGDRVVMVNDDKPLISVNTPNSPQIYGTPWNGKHNLSTNIAVPLKAIVYLERGEENEIHEIDAKEIFPVLVQQTFRTEDVDVTMKVLDLLSQLASKLKFYDLHCNLDPEAAKVAYSGIFPAED